MTEQLTRKEIAIHNHNPLQLEVTIRELEWISEALENFAQAVPPTDQDYEPIQDLFERVDERRIRELGEPEEGY